MSYFQANCATFWFLWRQKTWWLRVGQTKSMKNGFTRFCGNAHTLREKLERTRDLMNLHVFGALVEGYEGLIPALQLPDPNDRHVLAAAIFCGARRIISFNTSDFPASILRPYNLIAQTPDEFLLELFEENSEAVLMTLRQQRLLLQRPPQTPAEFLETLSHQGLPRFVAALKPHENEL